nr:probable inactive DNA (cytosine-5)-methyltransferase DRM3 isoform X1 [Tanacetum cinerariifolium]
MYQINNLSDSEDDMEFKPDPVTITQLDPNGFPSLRSIGENGASSSGTNVRSTLLGMGFAHDLVEKAIRRNGEENMDLLLESLFAYSTLETSKRRSLPPANGYKDEELAQSNGKRKAVLISNSESSDSLECLFGDEKDVSSRSTAVPTTNSLKEDPDGECCDVMDDKKASLLMMNFTMEEVEFAISKLGEDAPVNELVDFIFAAQMASADDLNQTRPTRNEQEATTETMFGTMDKTLRLLEIGFTEQDISVAIEKYGGAEVSIQELAEAIVCARMGGPYVKTEEDPFLSHGDDSWMGNKFKSASMGATKVLDASFYTNLALRTEETIQASKIKDLNPVDSFKGKQPKEEEQHAAAAAEPIGLQRPKPEFADDLISYSGSSRTAPKPPVRSTVSERQRKYKERRKAAMAVPKLIQPASCSSVDRMVAKAPLFFYGNVTNLSHDSWVKISQHLYAIKPEVVNTQFFSALSRKEGYIHNLPTENRFHVLPKPPMTIEEAIPETKKYWPSWDTRKQLSCISSETLGISQLCGSLRDILKSSKGILSPEQQKDILHQCKSLSLMWVGRNRLAPTEPESVERILGGVGGAEITLNRLGIRLKAVVSIEPSEPRRKILRQWWENSDQTGELVQIATIQKLSSSKLESLMDKFGVFDFIICQNPYTYSARSVTMATATETESYTALDMTMFFEFVRVLRIVRSAIKTD